MGVTSLRAVAFAPEWQRLASTRARRNASSSWPLWATATAKFGPAADIVAAGVSAQTAEMSHNNRRTEGKNRRMPRRQVYTVSLARGRVSLMMCFAGGRTGIGLTGDRQVYKGLA